MKPRAINNLHGKVEHAHQSNERTYRKRARSHPLRRETCGKCFSFFTSAFPSQSDWSTPHFCDLCSTSLGPMKFKWTYPLLMTIYIHVFVLHAINFWLRRFLLRNLARQLCGNRSLKLRKISNFASWIFVIFVSGLNYRFNYNKIDKLRENSCEKSREVSCEKSHKISREMSRWRTPEKSCEISH